MDNRSRVLTEAERKSGLYASLEYLRGEAERMGFAAVSQLLRRALDLLEQNRT